MKDKVITFISWYFVPYILAILLFITYLLSELIISPEAFTFKNTYTTIDYIYVLGVVNLMGILLGTAAVKSFKKEK